MLKIFFAIFLTVNTFSFFNYPHNRKGVTINMDQFDPSQVALKSGESAKVSGSICVAKYHTITNKAKCYKLKKGNLPVRFYFPDKNTEVTNDVTFSEKGNDYSFLYSTPELVKNSENKFIVVVAEDNNRIKHLEQTQAKLNKRILFLKDRVLFFQNKPHHEKVVVWLNHLLSILESTSRKLDKLFDEDPSILATMEYPLQVDNEYASVFRYSTFFSGHKLSLEIDNGSVIDGEKAKVLAKTVNLSHLSFWFPDIGDSDDGDDESFKSDGLNDYKLVLKHDGKELFDSGFKNLNFGSDISKTIEISSIDYLNNNNFEVLLYKNRKSFFFFNKFFQTLYGSISHDLNVAIDGTVPVISNVIPEDTLKYAQNLEKIEAIISDNFGRINPSSIVLSHSFQGETSNVEVTKTELDFERKVKIFKALGTLSEGDHEFKIQASDYAGNEVVETRSLKIDRTPPVILLGASGNILTNNPVFKIPVQITDASPVEVSIVHNGAIIEFLDDAEFERNITLLEGMNDIEIMTKDAAGNIASQKLEGIELDTIAPTLLSLSPEEGSIINELSLALRFTFSEKYI